MRSLPLFLLVVALASAQPTEERKLRLQTPVTDQDFQDVSVAALTISDLKAQGGDVAARELAISGPGERVRLAEWVFAQLDRPASSSPLPASNLYTVPNEPESAVRVFYSSPTATEQDFRELTTALRTITDIRRVGIYTAQRAIVVRGTRDQLDLAEWLLAEMNRDAPQQAYVYPKTGDARYDEDNQIRVFRYLRAPDVQQFNEVQTMIRTLTDTRRVYPYISKRAIVLRGTEEQLDMAQWILAQLDKPLPLAQKASSSDYAMKSGEVMKLYYFDGAMNAQTFNETQTAIRTATGIRRVYPFTPARTLGARGTAAQMAQLATLATQ